jgi:hypothetical protein
MSIIITVGIIILMFAWVPFLNRICPCKWRSDKESSPENKKAEIPQRTVSSLPSKRLANRSGEFLHALSTREKQSISRSQTSGSRVSPNSCAE